MSFQRPPITHNPDNQERRAGFEFEFADVDIQTCSEIIAELFGGKIKYKNALEAEVTDTPMGNFKVELDAQMLKSLAAKLEMKHPVEEDSLLDMNQIRAALSARMGQAAGLMVPYEIVTPPMPFDQLPKLEALRQKLQEKDAKGTRSAFVNAFGTHINPEVASEKVSYIRDILRAFLILYPWLKKVMRIDLPRRMLTYIDPFPEAYVKLVLQDDYDPSLDQFIEDYLAHNPTRNRALDLLPLFAHLKPSMLDGLDEGQRKLVKARPTFHYRLPNCEIDDPDWRIARDWNYWIEVEKLANDPEKLRSMAADYLKFQETGLPIFSADWSTEVAEKLGYDA
ncbi:amidoligase family protein [Sneathiella sp.]|jgi:hypothetical protein|uniref:amidoligase family protein n=1 Tax=Sneathiella sp. TaxID=1964365 RepID=UPI0039E62190